MILIFVLFFQELGIEDPGQILAKAIYSGNKKEVALTDLKIKGPDPFFITLNYKSETEFVAIYKVAHIIKDPDRPHWYKIIFVSGEETEAQLRGVIFKAVIEGEPTENLTIKLRDLDQISIYSGERLKSCMNCSYETNTAYWFCPRCGHELAIGSFEENEEKKQIQPPLIRYRNNTRDQ